MCAKRSDGKKIGYVLAATQALCEGDTATPIQERGGPGQKKVLRSLEELRQLPKLTGRASLQDARRVLFSG